MTGCIKQPNKIFQDKHSHFKSILRGEIFNRQKVFGFSLLFCYKCIYNNIKLSIMHQKKFTFNNPSNSYSKQGSSQLFINQSKPNISINVNSSTPKPAQTKTKTYQDPYFNQSSNVQTVRNQSYNHNSTISFDNPISSKYSLQQKVVISGNINESINKIQQQLYKKKEGQSLFLNHTYDAFPKVLKQTKVSKDQKKIEVHPFKIDTSDFQTAKEKDFIGCFHCFSSVKYEVSNGK